MGDHYLSQKKVHLFEFVIGAAKGIDSDKQQRNQQRFDSLSESDQQVVVEGYQSLLNQQTAPFKEKFTRSIWKLLIETPAFELAWLLFTLLISLFLLLKIDGARQAVWLLPLLAAAYTVDNYFFGTLPPASSEEALFPTEEYIVAHYHKGSLSPNILEQQKELAEGWHRYLAAEWAMDNSVESGEYTFTLARVKAIAAEKRGAAIRGANNEKESPWMLLGYVLWNFSFAWVAGQRQWTKDLRDLKKIYSALNRVTVYFKN